MPTKHDEDKALEKLSICKGIGLKGKISLTITLWRCCWVHATKKHKVLNWLKCCPLFYSLGGSNIGVQPASFSAAIKVSLPRRHDVKLEKFNASYCLKITVSLWACSKCACAITKVYPFILKAPMAFEPASCEFCSTHVGTFKIKILMHCFHIRTLCYNESSMFLQYKSS